MKKTLIGIAAAALVLAGCSSESAEPLPTATYQSEPQNVDKAEESPADGGAGGGAGGGPDDSGEDGAKPGARNARGHIEKQIGEEGAVFLEEGALPPYPVAFTVTELEVGHACAGQWATPSENGHFIAVSMTITTGPGLHDLTWGSPLWVSNHDFQVVGLDGVVENDVATVAAFSCLDDKDQFPQNGIGPGVTVHAKFVVDTKAESGYLAFTPGWTNGGWEYAF